MEYDVIIIGAGVVGGSIARELSRYELSVLCLEKEADVCCGISKANTGIIHSPALVPSGTMKAGMNIRGAHHFDQLSSQLGFGYQRPGALVLGYREEDERTLEKYIQQGIIAYEAAGLTSPSYRILRVPELRRLEPEINPAVRCALWAPDCGRIIPYEYGIALWENAAANGVKLELNSKVTSVSPGQTKSGSRRLWSVRTEREEVRAGWIVNAAGHGSSEIAAFAGFEETAVNRVKGQYLILDREAGPEVNHILFQVPQAGQAGKGKGILVTRTVYGNIMIGPDARQQYDDNDTSTDIEALEKIIEGARMSISGIDPKRCIKTFAGVRPKPAGGDFVISAGNGFVNLCGIESPGLTSSPAIAAETVRQLENMGLGLKPRSDFNPERRTVVEQVLDLPPDEIKRRIALPAGDPDRLVCRCEQVPERRIADALNRGIPVATIDGVKRRTRAGQGRCQGNFCGSRVRSLLAEDLGLPEDEITQRGSEPELKRITAREIRAHRW